MMHAVNVRLEQWLDSERTCIQLRTDRARLALGLLEEEFAFYEPRTQDPGRYIGVGILCAVTPFKDDQVSCLEFSDVRWLDHPATAHSLAFKAPSVSTAHWYDYAATIRKIPADLEAEIRELVGQWRTLSQPGLGSGTTDLMKRDLRSVLVRNSKLRFEVLEAYGEHCVFTGSVHRGSKPGRISTQVGHIIPLRNGGADDITNAVPMSPLVNWLWDEGNIGLDENGTVVVAPDACSQTRALVTVGAKIPFVSPQIWPRAEYIRWHRTQIFGKGPSSITNWRKD